MLDTLARPFTEGFRVFFLAAGLFGVASLAYWELWLGVHAAGGMVTGTPFAMAPHLWHAHEMIWGFAGAVLGGFFLTAVPNWTGGRPAAVPFLAAVSGVWLAGRLAVWVSGTLDPWLVAAADLAFLPLLAAKLVAMLVRRPKPQNVMLIGLLSLLWAGNLMVHLDWTGLWPGAAWEGMRAGLLTVAAMIAVVGGRITPAFTRNALRRRGRETGLPRETGPLDRLGLASAILLPVLVLLGAPETALAAAALAAGGLHAARLAGWRGLAVLDEPLLWSMHAAYALLAAGYLALALAYWAGTSEVAALHVLGIGAIGGMTLTVMSRASLGHTGRALTAPRPVVAAFAMLLAATGLRAAGSYGGLDLYYATMLAAGALWIGAFGLFLATFWGPLTRPRPDRQAEGGGA